MRQNALSSLAQAFINRWLDYCNAMLYGWNNTDIYLKRLQSAHNTSPRKKCHERNVGTTSFPFHAASTGFLCG